MGRLRKTNRHDQREFLSWMRTRACVEVHRCKPCPRNSKARLSEGWSLHSRPALRQDPRGSDNRPLQMCCDRARYRMWCRSMIGCTHSASLACKLSLEKFKPVSWSPSTDHSAAFAKWLHEQVRYVRDYLLLYFDTLRHKVVGAECTNNSSRPELPSFRKARTSSQMASF